MKRGIVNVTVEEIKALSEIIDFAKYQGTPLFEKIMSVLQSAGVTPIELSEDEIENMLDEIVLPINGEKNEITSLRSKFTQKLLEFRS